MSLDIEQYGTCDNVEQVFHNKYIISIYAINPFVETPQSFTGINSRNIDTIIEMPPANIYGLRLPHLPRVLSLIKPLKEKICYGIGGLMDGGGVALMSCILVKYMTTMGIPMKIATTIFMIAKLWDAVTDPVMGSLSSGTI